MQIYTVRCYAVIHQLRPMMSDVRFHRRVESELVRWLVRENDGEQDRKNGGYVV